MTMGRNWQRHRRKGVATLVYLVAAAAAALVAVASGGPSAAPHGLTTYGEPCSDPCTHRGFPYTWCHKRPSRNGTWVDRDYCSAAPGTTRYGEPCLDECRRRAPKHPFHSCLTRKTFRGDWDYCSPQYRSSGTAAGEVGADAPCLWSTWGPWSACSATCGSRSTRTRRRRMEEGGAGRVGKCSGEIEQSIRSCRIPECPRGKKKNTGFINP